MFHVRIHFVGIGTQIYNVTRHTSFSNSVGFGISLHSLNRKQCYKEDSSTKHKKIKIGTDDVTKWANKQLLTPSLPLPSQDETSSFKQHHEVFGPRPSDFACWRRVCQEQWITQLFCKWSWAQARWSLPLTTVKFTTLWPKRFYDDIICIGQAALSTSSTLDSTLSTPVRSMWTSPLSQGRTFKVSW